MNFKKVLGVSLAVAILMLPKIGRADKLAIYKEKRQVLHEFNYSSERKIFRNQSLLVRRPERKRLLKVGNPISRTSTIIKDKPSKYEAKFTLNSNLYTINGKLRNNKGEPIELNGNIFVPIKTIAGVLDIKADYNKEDKTVFLTHSDFDALFSIETGKIAIVKKKERNDDIKVLDSLVVNHQDENYVPITALKEIGFIIQEGPDEGFIKISYN